MGEYRRKLEARQALKRVLTPGEYALVVGSCPTRRLSNSIPASVLIEQGRAAAEKALRKGKFDGNCNRTACQDPIAGNNWFNTSTRAYYCEGCAWKIDEFGTRRGEPRMCVAVTDPNDQPPFDWTNRR